MMKYLGYFGFVLAIIAGARHIHGVIILVLAFGITLLFGKARRNVDKTRRSALVPNPFFDGIYFFASNMLIVFVCYILGYFATSGGGEMFGMWIQQEVLRRPADG